MIQSSLDGIIEAIHPRLGFLAITGAIVRSIPWGILLRGLSSDNIPYHQSQKCTSCSTTTEGI